MTEATFCWLVFKVGGMAFLVLGAVMVLVALFFFSCGMVRRKLFGPYEWELTMEQTAYVAKQQAIKRRKEMRDNPNAQR